MKLLSVITAAIALTVSGGAFQVQAAKAADPLDMIGYEVLHDSCAFAAQRHPGHFPGAEASGPDAAESPDQPGPGNPQGPDGTMAPKGLPGGENMRGHEMKRPDPLKWSFLKYLALTDAQKKKIFLAILDQREKEVTLMKKRDDLHVQLCKAEQGTPFDENAVRSITANLAAIEADMSVSRVNGRKRISEILTAEQREMVKKLKTIETGTERHHPAEP